MNAKRKIIISVCAFALIVVATIVSVIAVLAAQSVTVSSSVNVTYTTREVAGTVTAKYQVANGSATNIGTGSKTYYGTETSGTTNLTSSKLSITSLTSTNKYVDFIFTFRNTITYTVPNNYNSSTKVGATKKSDTSFELAGNTTTAVTYTIRYTITDVSKAATLDGNFSWELKSVNATS